ncbi:MAG: hypothetical protein IJ220_00730 [Clostridia bacterium]|nr:hypothetical protein [Clostridia bacterium]
MANTVRRYIYSFILMANAVRHYIYSFILMANTVRRYVYSFILMANAVRRYRSTIFKCFAFLSFSKHFKIIILRNFFVCASAEAYDGTSIHETVKAMHVTVSAYTVAPQTNEKYFAR